MPRRWNPMTAEQRAHRGLDPERRPADLAQICAAIAALKAEKLKQGEPCLTPPSGPQERVRRRVYRDPRPHRPE